MDAANPLFRLGGVLVVALTSLIARADGVSQLQISPVAVTENADQIRTAAMPKLAKDILQIAPTPATSDANGEMVTERYPNGSVKIERQVIKDAAENYVNQGTYTEYDQNGKVQKTGEFLDGKQQGKWTQTLSKDDGHLFSADRDAEFLGPFTSEATFVDGQLHGTWNIKDRTGQKIVEWNFDHGVRDGKWNWCFSNGEKRLEATFKSGNLDGDVSEWSHDGKLVDKKTYIDGRHLARTVGWYTLGQKHFEGYYLRVVDMPEPAYDWWKGTVTTAATIPTGADLKHGVWTEWYRSGNKKTEAQYDHGVATGKFTWWYENGQKKAEVDYQSGVLGGTWLTWHANGLKESQAVYRDGELVDKWMHWDADGKLVELRDLSKVPAVAPKSNPTPNPTPIRQSSARKSPSR
jgi:antitoxin component YwqK of YwqJK toxin-antitoxin module